MNKLDAARLVQQFQAQNLSSVNNQQKTTKSSDFINVLSNSVDAINAQQEIAATKATAYEQGEAVSLTEVMLEQQKAEITLQAGIQVRNKLVQAYQEIMNMQI